MRPLLTIENLTVRYEFVEALTNLSMTINEGDFVGIIGPNGGGKSTLVKSILGLIRPHYGEIIFDKAVKDNKIGYVPQLSQVNSNFPITVREAVLMGKLPKKSIPFFGFNKDDNEEVVNVLDQVGLLELADRQVNQLSGGEFKKVLIARALISNPEILILDEPAAMVDRNSRNQIYQLLENLKGKVTIILITHDVTDTKHLITDLYNVNQTIEHLYHDSEVYTS